MSRYELHKHLLCFCVSFITVHVYKVQDCFGMTLIWCALVCWEVAGCCAELCIAVYLGMVGHWSNTAVYCSN